MSTSQPVDECAYQSGYAIISLRAMQIAVQSRGGLIGIVGCKPFVGCWFEPSHQQKVELITKKGMIVGMRAMKPKGVRK